MKLNNKGYMLVEIIVCSVVTLFIAYFLLDLTLSFKDKSEIAYYNAKYMLNKDIIKKNVMDDYEKYELKKLIHQDISNQITLDFVYLINSEEVTKRLTLKEEKEKNIIKYQYGTFENNKYNLDKYYYEEKIEGLNNLKMTVNTTCYGDAKKIGDNCVFDPEYKGQRLTKNAHTTVTFTGENKYLEEDFNTQILISYNNNEVDVVPKSSIVFNIDKLKGGVFINEEKTIPIQGVNYGTLSCESSDEKIATCEARENDLLIKAKNFGQTFLKVEEARGNSELVYDLTVEPIEKNIEYTGSYIRYVAPKSGYYQMQLWGASGGYGNDLTLTYGGKGSYTNGHTYLEEGDIIYIYTGGKGQDTITASTDVIKGGYNGGGDSIGTAKRYNGSGGGSTDIRYFGDYEPTDEDLVWNSTLGLNSRIIVAAGGGAGAYETTSAYGNGGDGGRLIGEKGYTKNSSNTLGQGGTQITGGTGFKTATFGAGATFTSTVVGGGGGYYGGGAGKNTGGSGGGSSFISGYAGVNAITSETNRNHSNNILHYSGKYFIKSQMLSGINEENGKAIITYVGEKPERINSNLDNVRYIKDCINGSSANTGNHWVELQAIKDGVNLAKGITPTGTVAQTSTTYPYTKITDGSIVSSAYGASKSTGNQCITIDLGQAYDLDETAVWHYWSDGRKYKGNVLSVSSDNLTYREILNDTDVPVAETSQGKRIDAYN